MTRSLIEYFRGAHSCIGRTCTARFTGIATAGLFLVLAGAQSVRADDYASKIVDGIPQPSLATSLAKTTGSSGYRKMLADKGFTFTFIYTNEVLRNVAGGVRRGNLFEGKVDAQFTIDLEKMAGFNGLTFYTNIFQLHRTRGPRHDFTGSLITVSNIEARSTTRLSELWFEQKFWGEKASLRIGQLATDQEFFIASFSDMFLNADWPAITASNLPGGGPAYPLSTPGIRLKYEPVKSVTLLTALLNGNPAPPGAGDPDRRNRHGVNFRLQDPPLWIGEAQVRYNQEAGLAGMVRIGAWHHFGKFDSLRFGTDGLSLASPLSNGTALRMRGGDGIYGIIDQQIYRPEGGGPDSGIGVFSRISKALPSNRNLIDFYIDGGIIFSGMIPQRPEDKFGATFIYAHISKKARQLDQDSGFLAGINRPLRSAELTAEISYQAQIIPGWILQPVVQYIHRPGGGDPHPADPTQTTRIKDAKLIGLRSIARW